MVSRAVPFEMCSDCLNVLLIDVLGTTRMLERAWISQTLATFASKIHANPILDSRWEDVWVFGIGILEVKHPHILLDIPSSHSCRTLVFLAGPPCLDCLPFSGVAGERLSSRFC
jgi:hypothetical protein